MMAKSPRRRILILLLVSLATLGTAMRSGTWENIRTVDALLLVSTGLCLGAAISLLVQYRNSPAAKDEMH